MVFAVNDGRPDYYRLSHLIHECNAVQLKRMETDVDGRRIIPRGQGPTRSTRHPL